MAWKGLVEASSADANTRLKPSGNRPKIRASIASPGYYPGKCRADAVFLPVCNAPAPRPGYFFQLAMSSTLTSYFAILATASLCASASMLWNASASL